MKCLAKALFRTLIGFLSVTFAGGLYAERHRVPNQP
jgi:hypothetical protein